MPKTETDIEFKENALWITGERKHETEEKEKTYHRVERQYGFFRRIVRLGPDVAPESINAKYKDGVLTISVAKVESARSKRINVQS